jgi:hypothetical protein
VIKILEDGGNVVESNLCVDPYSRFKYNINHNLKFRKSVSSERCIGTWECSPLICDSFGMSKMLGGIHPPEFIVM